MEQEGETFHVHEITKNLESESSDEGAGLMLKLSECFHHIAFLENQNDFLRLKLKLTINHCLDNNTKDSRGKDDSNDQQKDLKEQFVQTDAVLTRELDEGNYSSPVPSRKNTFDGDDMSREKDVDESNMEDEEDGDLLKTPVVVELSNSLSNLKWGFKKRESKLKKELKNYKAALQYLHANHDELRTKFKGLCNSLCDQLDTAEVVQQLREQQKEFLQEQETHANELIDQLSNHDSMLKATLQKISSEVHNLAEEAQAQLETGREKTILARSERNQYLLAAKELEAELEEQELAMFAETMGTQTYKKDNDVISNTTNDDKAQLSQLRNDDKSPDGINNIRSDVVAPEPEQLIAPSQEMISAAANKQEKKKKDKKRKEKRHSSKKSSRRSKKVSHRSSKKRRFEESSDDSHSIASYSSSSASSVLSGSSFHSSDSLSSTPRKKKHSSKKHASKSLKKDVASMTITEDIAVNKDSHLRQQLLEHRIADEEFLESIVQTQDKLGEWLSKVHEETHNFFLSPLKNKYTKDSTMDNGDANTELERQLTLAQEIITQLTMEKHKLEEELKRQKIDFDGQNRAKMRLLQELEAKNEELLNSRTQQPVDNDLIEEKEEKKEENDELNALLFTASPSDSPPENSKDKVNAPKTQSFSQQTSFISHSHRAMSSAKLMSSSQATTNNVSRVSYSTPAMQTNASYLKSNVNNTSYNKDEDSEETLAMERILDAEAQELHQEPEFSGLEEAKQASSGNDVAHVIGDYEFEEGEEEVEEDVHVISSVDDPFLSSPSRSRSKLVETRSSFKNSSANINNTSVHSNNNASTLSKQPSDRTNKDIINNNNSNNHIQKDELGLSDPHPAIEEEKMSVEELLLGGKKPPKVPSSAITKHTSSANNISRSRHNNKETVDAAEAMEELRRMLHEVETDKETLSIQCKELLEEKDSWMLEKVTLQQDKRALEKENETLAKENLRLKREVDLYRTKIFTVVTQDASQRTSSIASNMIQGLPDINLSFVASSQGLSANAVASEYAYLAPAGGHNASQQTLYIINQLVHAHNDLVERNTKLEDAHNKEQKLALDREKQLRVHLQNLQEQEQANLKMKRLLAQANSTISATVDDYRVLQEQVNLLTQKLTELREENVHLQALVPPALRHQAIRFATQSVRQQQHQQQSESETPALLLKSKDIAEDTDVSSFAHQFDHTSFFSDIVPQQVLTSNNDVSRESLYHSSSRVPVSHQPRVAAVRSPPPLPYTPVSPRLRHTTAATPLFSPPYTSQTHRPNNNFNHNFNNNNNNSSSVSTADLVARLQHHTFHNYTNSGSVYDSRAPESINRNNGKISSIITHAAVQDTAVGDTPTPQQDTGRTVVSRGDLEAKLLEYSRRYPNSHTANHHSNNNSSNNRSYDNNKVLTYSSM